MFSKSKKVPASLQSQSGMAIYEFIMTLPLYMLMMGGIVSYSTYMYDTQIMAEAAYAGTSAAAQLSSGTAPLMITATASNTVATFLEEAGLEVSEFVWRVEPIVATVDERGRGISDSIKVTVGKKERPIIRLWTAIQFNNSCPTSTAMLAGENTANELTGTIPDC